MIAAPALSALNHLLAQASWARSRLAPFAGRRAQFDLPPWRLVFVVTADGLCEAAVGDEPDVTIGLPADAPLLALQGIDRVMTVAHVSGNAEFATALSFVLKNLRWDAEEDLSKLVGDIAAHRLVGGAASLIAWQRQSRQRLVENLGEYLTEESRLLAPGRELADFRREIDQLVDGLAVLQARVRRLG